METRAAASHKQKANGGNPSPPLHSTPFARLSVDPPLGAQSSLTVTQAEGLVGFCEVVAQGPLLDPAASHCESNTAAFERRTLHCKGVNSFFFGKHFEACHSDPAQRASFGPPCAGEESAFAVIKEMQILRSPAKRDRSE